jgi:type IV pilus assembly protein PilW
MRWNKGFTLVEILISIAVAGVVMAGIYSAYSSQQRSYIVQEQVAGMQQNLRASMDLMEREIRMAGYDPTGYAGAKIIKADIAELKFTIDLNGNRDVSSSTGNTNEQIRYRLTVNGGLGREVWGSGLQPVAENIDAINFVYLDQRLSDGIDNDGDGTIDEYDEAIMATPVVNTENIRAIQITLVARTGRGDPHYKDTAIYRNQQGAVILLQQNDHFRRKLLTAQVCCRNLDF